MSNLHISFCFQVYIAKTKDEIILNVARLEMFKEKNAAKIKRQKQRPNPIYNNDNERGKSTPIDTTKFVWSTTECLDAITLNRLHSERDGANAIKEISCVSVSIISLKQIKSNSIFLLSELTIIITDCLY